jgi:serine/threonine-protein kinase
MYEMLVKKPPFLANNPIAVAYKHVHELPISPSVKRRDTPKRLELIVLKALKKKKSERYATVAEMLDHLDSVDINELITRPTITFSDSEANKNKANDIVIAEKRITDRRSGERRRDLKPILFLLHDREYWIEIITYQWPILVVLLILAVILARHILQK